MSTRSRDKKASALIENARANGTGLEELSREERRAVIESKETPKGSHLRADLARWGVPWLPPKGWKDELIRYGRLSGSMLAKSAERNRHATQRQREAQSNPERSEAPSWIRITDESWLAPDGRRLPIVVDNEGHCLVPADTLRALLAEAGWIRT